MNTIKTDKRLSIYKIYDKPYDEIFIDELPLDEYLDKIYPGKDIKGLVPTISGWLIDKKDEEIVWDRIIPTSNLNTICPILVCPDDQDYYCTTVVVEIENREDIITWKRFGFNKKYDFRNYEMIGKEVEWFEDVIKLDFYYIEYKHVITKIRSNKESET